MIRAGGLWRNQDRNGNTYLAGNLGGVRVIVFMNREKKGEKSPDATLYFDENKPKEQRGGDDGEDSAPF
jgi:hypothetical protein